MAILSLEKEPSKVPSKTITSYLNEDYKEYAMYVLQSRAIPSIIDGFKPTQRKIIAQAIKLWKGTGSEKAMKVFQLSGSVAQNMYYHHGSASLEAAIINMAQRFKNNMPLLEDKGQYGSLRSPDAGAARYIETRLTENFRLLYKDFELLSPNYEEGVEIEPNYFLPIIPTILLNGSQGIAVGFSSKILNRDPKLLIEECLRFLEGKKVRDVPPTQREFNGTYEQDEENPKKWNIKGKYTINGNMITVSELPPSITYENYDELMDELLNDKYDKKGKLKRVKLIDMYTDNSSSNINYVAKINKYELPKYTEDALVKIFRLEESVTENFTMLNENGELSIFNNSSEIIEYFCNFRLSYYDKRKAYLLSKIEKDLNISDAKARFINAILKGDLKINNVAKAVIVAYLEKNKYFKLEDSYDYLLRMPIHSLTKEMCQKLMEDIKIKKTELAEMKKSDPKQMYREDLMELRRKINKQ